jgi:hypothetical protein
MSAIEFVEKIGEVYLRAGATSGIGSDNATLSLIRPS